MIGLFASATVNTNNKHVCFILEKTVDRSEVEVAGFFSLLPALNENPDHLHTCIFYHMQNSKPKSSDGQVTTPTENINEKPKTPPKKSISMSSMTSSMEICRICHCEAEPDLPLISPCVCAGSLQYVHQSCLQRWIKSSDTKKCELCKYEFRMESKMKPITKVSHCVHTIAGLQITVGHWTMADQNLPMSDKILTVSSNANANAL